MKLITRQSLARDERRCKLYCLAESEILNILRAYDQWPQCVYMGRIKGPPDGSEVVSVHADYNRRCIVAMVWNKDFEINPEGSVFPYANNIAVLEFTAIVRGPDGAYRNPSNPGNVEFHIDDDTPEVALQAIEQRIKEIRYDRERKHG